MPLSVYVLGGSRIRGTGARTEIEGATRIWERGAGIRFTVVHQEIVGEAETRRLLHTQGERTRGVGANLRVLQPREAGQSFLERDAEHLRVLRRFHAERSGGKGLAVFFVESTSGGGYASPYHRLIVVSERTPDEWNRRCPPGRTVAHEIGHVFLGRGHSTTYSQREAQREGRRVILSPLMNPNRCDGDIEESECRIARENAQRLL